MRYWLFKDNQVTGPFEPEDLSQQPSFSSEALVCPEGRKGTSMGDWQRAGVLPELSVSLIKASSLQPVGAASGGGGVFGSLPPEPTLRDLAALGSLQEKISVLESALGQMQEQLRYKDTELLALHREVEEKKRREAEMATKVGGLEERLTSMAKMRENLDETMAAEKAVESSVKDVEHTVKDVESAIKEMEATVGRQRETIEKLDAELREVKEQREKDAALLEQSRGRPAAAPSPLSEPPAQVPPSPFGGVEPKPGLSPLGGLEPAPKAAPKPAPLPLGSEPVIDLDAPEPAPGFPDAGMLKAPSGLERAPQKLEPIKSFEPAPVPVSLDAVKPAQPIAPLFDPTAGASLPPVPAPEPQASLKPAPSAVPVPTDLAGGAAPLVDQGSAAAAKPAAGGGKKKLVLVVAVIGALGVAGFLGMQMGFLGGKGKLAPAPASEETQEPLPPPEPQAPAPTAADLQLEELKSQAIGLVRMWPAGGSTAGAKLEALPSSSAQASPWFAEKLAEGLFQVNYYAAAPTGQVVYEFQVRPAEKQVSALNTAARELLEAKKPEAPKAPRKVRVRPKAQPVESSGMLDNPLGSALGEEPAAPEEPAAAEEADPVEAAPVRKAKRAAKAAPKSAKAAKAADEAALEDLLSPSLSDRSAQPASAEPAQPSRKAAKEPSDSELLDELLQP